MNEYIEAKDLEDFRDEIMTEFRSLCHYNDYNEIALFRIEETIDRIYDKYYSKKMLLNFVSEERCYEIAREMIPQFVRQARAEAIKEFADKLQEYLADHNAVSASYLSKFVKKLAKELTEGDSNAEITE